MKKACKNFTVKYKCMGCVIQKKPGGTSVN